MTDPYRSTIVQTTGPEPFGARLLATLHLWKPLLMAVAIIAASAGIIISAFWWAVTYEDRECADACATIRMPAAVYHNYTCYCIDEDGQAWPWPERPANAR